MRRDRCVAVRPLELTGVRYDTDIRRRATDRYWMTPPAHRAGARRIRSPEASRLAWTDPSIR
jgi:hypothetical protein